MSDPRLNSIHLEAPRRDEFRRAREALLDGRGLHTLAAEKHELSHGRGPHTHVEPAAGNAPASSDHWLICREALYPLKIGVNTIGRLPDNDVVIQGPYVSRRHCAILVHAGDGCELYDIASKNGTFINGLRLSGPAHLNAGDEIRMCDRQFVFMSRRGPDGADPAHDFTKAE